MNLPIVVLVIVTFLTQRVSVCYKICKTHELSFRNKRSPQTNHLEDEFTRTHGDNGNSEIVGGRLGLLGLRTLNARVRNQAMVARARARAHMHPPLLLLQSTPKQFLDDDDGNVPSPLKETMPGHSGVIKKAGSNSTRNQHSFLRSSQNDYLQNPSVVVEKYYEEPGEYGNYKSSPSFSIIPINWKPPPESNLYGHGSHPHYISEAEVSLDILPGKWTNAYDGDYYENYHVIPVSYNLHESSYGRSADQHQHQRFSGIKEQMRGWKDNPKIWRPDKDVKDSASDTTTSKNRRIAEPEPHFHHHHKNLHTVVHQHVFNQQPTAQHDFSQVHHQSTFVEHPHHHSGAFVRPTHSFHQSATKPQEHQITINKQTVVVQPETNPNFQIAQVAGSHNAVSQSQANNRWKTQNFQTGQVAGNHNALSQSQSFSSNHEAPFLSTNAGPIVKSPYIIRVPQQKNVWRSHYNEVPSARFVKKRSVDNNFIDENNGNYKKAIEEQHQILNHMKQLAQHDKELLFLTELESNMLNQFENEVKPKDSRPRIKRSIPILRLVLDPNAKLDVSKTLENVGTVVRNSFQNKRAPLYHVKNVLGSAKDAFLSTLRIPPQNLIIPSKYEIVDKDESYSDPNVGASVSKYRQNEGFASGEPLDSSNTYEQIGSMLRQSIESGKDALSHVGDVYHSARKAFATTRNVAPRVLLSSMRIPAVQRAPLKPSRDKMLMITPKILQLKQEGVGTPHYSDNNREFVGMPDVMNSLGLANPQVDDVGLRRIVFHPVTSPNLQSRSRFTDEDTNEEFLQKKPIEERKSSNLARTYKKYYILADNLQKQASEDVHETLNALNNAKETIGASSLKDFVLKMKSDFSSLFKSKLEEAKHKFRVNLVSPVVNLDFRKQKIVENANVPQSSQKFVPEEPFTAEEKQRVSNFLNDLFKPKDVQNFEQNNFEPLPSEVALGAGLPLASQLLRPFMGQPSQAQRRNFFEELGDVEELENKEENQNDGIIGKVNTFSFRKPVNASSKPVIAIVPLDQTTALVPIGKATRAPTKLKVSTEPSQNVETTPLTTGTLEEQTFPESESESGRTSMKIGKHLLTPFMGKIKDKNIEVYEEDYGPPLYGGNKLDDEVYLGSSNENNSPENFSNVNSFDENKI